MYLFDNKMATLLGKGYSSCRSCVLLDLFLIGSCPLGTKDVDGLFVPPGKAYMLHHLITDQQLRFEPAHKYEHLWFT